MAFASVEGELSFLGHALRPELTGRGPEGAESRAGVPRPWRQPAFSSRGQSWPLALVPGWRNGGSEL